MGIDIIGGLIESANESDLRSHGSRHSPIGTTSTSPHRPAEVVPIGAGGDSKWLLCQAAVDVGVDCVVAEGR
jgi:hypothetical protein